jgi:hypothetical protein
VKLEHFESLLILAHALLHEKDQASEIINLDGNRYNHIKPPEEREHQQAKDDTERTLDTKLISAKLNLFATLLLNEDLPSNDFRGTQFIS